jgi:MFS family permease
VRELIRVPGFLHLTVAFSMMSIANTVVFTWLPVYVYERFHVSLTDAGFSATFYVQVGSFSGILIGGWMADRWAHSSGRGRVLTQVVGLAAAAPFLVVAAFTSSPVLLAICLLTFGLGRGMFDCNAMPVLCQIARVELRSMGYGIFNFAGCLCGGLMAAVAGYLKSTLGLVAAFVLAGLVLLSAVGLLLRVRLERVPQLATNAISYGR